MVVSFIILRQLLPKINNNNFAKTRWQMAKEGIACGGCFGVIIAGIAILPNFYPISENPNMQFGKVLFVIFMIGCGCLMGAIRGLNTK